MTQHQFSASRWIQRLAKAIDRVLSYEHTWEDVLRERRLAESSTMGLPGRTHEDTRTERIKEYWLLRHERGTRQLTEYERAVLDMSTDVEEVILEHPIIKSSLGSGEDFTGIKVYSPSSRFPMSTEQIVEGILNYAIGCGALVVASALEERIRLGEKRNLVGSQVTLVHGIRVDGSHQLPNGMVVTSLEDVEDKVDLVHIGSLLLMQGLVQVSISSIGVVRWDYKWGPSIAPPDEDELKFTQMPQDLGEVADLALMALCLVCDAPITRIGSFGDNFDRRIARALCHRDRYITLNDLRTRLNLGVGSRRGQVLNRDVFPQISEVFSHLIHIRRGAVSDEADRSLTAERIFSMGSLYNDFKLGKARLTDMAYFVVTMLEREFPKERGQTAERYAISKKVLTRMSVLASTAGGLGQARKALGVNRELTTEETGFLEQSARRTILRTIEAVAEPDASRKKITLSELRGG